MEPALATDLYQLTMAGGYYSEGRLSRASFELSVQDLAINRGYFVAAGLESALDYLSDLSFSQDEVQFLRTLPNLSGLPASFFDEYLRGFRFRGDLWAVPEGTPMTAREPVLRVTGRLPEAQIVETALLSIILHQSEVATKAARIVESSMGRQVFDFSARRSQGIEAAIFASRAAFLGGLARTSNIEAGHRFGIPIAGTMGHSWVMSHETEIDAFKHYLAIYGDQSILLVDTYDSLSAVKQIVAAGLKPAGIRLDSGDLLQLSNETRRLLNAGRLEHTKIVASGDLDEYRIKELITMDAPIDVFAVGTNLVSQGMNHSLAGVYKLVEIENNGEWVPKLKLSPGKSTFPGRKQIWRRSEGREEIHDMLGLANEDGTRKSEALLRCVMRDGQRVDRRKPLSELRDRAANLIRYLPKEIRNITDPKRIPMTVSQSLLGLTESLRKSLGCSSRVSK